MKQNLCNIIVVRYVNRWLIGDPLGSKIIRTESLQRAITDSNGSFFREITQFANQRTCFTGHVICSWIFFRCWTNFLSHSHTYMHTYFIYTLGPGAC